MPARVLLKIAQYAALASTLPCEYSESKLRSARSVRPQVLPEMAAAVREALAEMADGFPLRERLDISDNEKLQRCACLTPCRWHGSESM